MDSGGIGPEAAGRLPVGDGNAVGDEAAGEVALEVPDRIEAPAEVLERVAKVGHLPVQDAMDVALAVIEEVAGPEVAVHDANLLGGRRWICPQPADGGTGDGQGLGFVRVQHRLPHAQLADPAALGLGGRHDLVKAQGEGIRPGDLAQDGPFVPGKGLVSGEIGLGPEQGGCRLETRDLRRHGEGQAQGFGPLLQPDHLGHRDLRAEEGAVGLELDPALGVDEADRRIPAQDHPALPGCAVLEPG